MGLARTPLTLSNPKDPDLAPIEVDALVDMSLVHVRVSESAARQLGSDAVDQRAVMVADGSTRLVPDVGPVVTSIGVRLGRITMDFVAPRLRGGAGPNPNNPNVPASIAPSFRYQ